MINPFSIGVNAVKGLITGTSGAVVNVAKVFKGSKAERDQQDHDRFIAGQAAYSAEFRNVANRNWFDSLVDGANRLMRPASLVLVFWYCQLSYTDPVKFQKLNLALMTIPPQMWYIIGGIFSFLWSFRHMQKMGENKLAMSKKDFTEVQRRIAELDTEVKTVKALPAPELPLHYLLARAEMDKDTKEVAGAGSNENVLKYHTATSLRATDDETAWCSAFVNWCVKTAGLIGTNLANAQSFLKWGTAVEHPSEGDIVVFQRGKEKWMGHVGFFVRFEGSQVMCLGGNQGNEVNISGYAKNRVLGYRRAS